MKRLIKRITAYRIALMFILPMLTLVVLFCTQHTIEPDPNDAITASCEGCHTDYAHLQLVHSPDTAEAVGGCGGDAPVYEPYDRVFMGGDGLDSFKLSSHYPVGCIGCHNGTDHIADKNLAHSGDFVAHPSMNPEESCITCHPDEVDHYATSLHTGTGQKRKVTMRSGLSGPEEFDKLPAHQIEGYNANCARCHGTCGNCHVIRPSTGGGGLSNGHAFTKTPDMNTVCITCHTSRGGHAYRGEGIGTVPDVHLTKMGFTCLNCHNGDELHGDGVMVEQRYAYDKLPACGDCHTDLADKNSYHSKHIDDFNCQVCHSQNYNNCGSCHIHGDGARIPAYMDFKIAKNPIPDIKTGYDLALVRRTLAAKDNWKEYGVADYANFDEFPTYNYTTPHNILKWTTRTEVASGNSCYANCHIRNDDGVLINKELYLFKENLLEWEHEATDKITVDDELPSYWFN